jgi:hypothetical protein
MLFYRGMVSRYLRKYRCWDAAWQGESGKNGSGKTSLEKRHRVGQVFVRLLVAGVISWLATACEETGPEPTLVPTLAATAIPSATPSAVVPTARPTSTLLAVLESVTLENYESYDFRREVVGALTQGDLYFVAASSRQGGACFWANNEPQVGGRDLGSWPLTALADQPLPRDRLSGQCIPVIQGHVYVYGLQGDRRIAVLRVTDTGTDSVTFDYLLLE